MIGPVRLLPPQVLALAPPDGLLLECAERRRRYLINSLARAAELGERSHPAWPLVTRLEDTAMRNSYIDVIQGVAG